MKVALAYFEKFIEMSGGIERVCCNMANALVERGHEVSVIYCYGRSGEPFYPLNSSVKLYNLMALHPEKWKNPSLSQCVSGKSKLIRELIRAFNANKARDWNEKIKGRMIREEIRQVIGECNPDVIIALRFETANYLLNAAEIKIPVVVRSYISPRVILQKAPAGELSAIGKSAAAHVQLQSDIPDMKAFCPAAHIVWIPNAVPQYNQQADLEDSKEKYTIIHVGRMNKEQKRQHLLIDAFAELAAEFPQWNVEFWGGGNESGASYVEELKKRIREYGLEDRVFLKGESTHIIDEYVRGDIFCFPSAYEGFPNALAEAMSGGLPPVVFKSCTAAAALVEEGKTGMLSDDGADALAQKLKQLMADQGLRIRMGKNAHEEMMEYAPEKIWNQWEQLLKDVSSSEENRIH